MALHLKTLADTQMVNNPTPRQKYVLQNQKLAAKVNSYAGSVDKLAWFNPVWVQFLGFNPVWVQYSGFNPVWV